MQVPHKKKKKTATPESSSWVKFPTSRREYVPIDESRTTARQDCLCTGDPGSSTINKMCTSAGPPIENYTGELNGFFWKRRVRRLGPIDLSRLARKKKMLNFSGTKQKHEGHGHNHFEPYRHPTFSGMVPIVYQSSFTKHSHLSRILRSFMGIDACFCHQIRISIPSDNTSMNHYKIICIKSQYIPHNKSQSIPCNDHIMSYLASLMPRVSMRGLFSRRDVMGNCRST